MSDTVSAKQKFKAAFGFVTADALAARKAEVGKVVKQLEDGMANLPKGTSDLHMAYHPGKKNNAADYLSLRVRLDGVSTGRTEKEAFAECGRIEEQTKAALKSLPALIEAEKVQAKMNGQSKEDLDKLANMLGDKLENDYSKGAMIAAIKARFGLDELGGELSSNALPRLYKALSKVPENHTKDNPKFQKLTRSKMSDTSLYGSGMVNINGGKAGPFSSEREKYTDGAGKKLEFSRFDAHTLHEVGHSVDDASGYMDKHATEANHGGWEKVQLGQVQSALARYLAKRHPTLGVELLADVVMDPTSAKAKWAGKANGLKAATAAALRDDPALKAADTLLDQFRTTMKMPLSAADATTVSLAYNLTQLVKPTKLTGPARMAVIDVLRVMRDNMVPLAKAVDLYEASVKAAADPKLIDKIGKEAEDWFKVVKKELWFNSGEVPKVAIDGKVYQQDGSVWWMYELAARGQMVKDYQFRSPAEWFAEVYTVAMLGKLSGSHPCAKIIKDIDTTKKIV